MISFPRFLTLIVLASFMGFSWSALAQRASASAAGDVEVQPVGLPDDPETTLAAQGAASGQNSKTAAFGSIFGTVLDSSGALVPGARLTLAGLDGATARTSSSGSGGEFSFSGLSKGIYRITVSSPGMGSYTSQDIAISTGERRQVERIVLNVATDRADVRVVVTQQELATEQVHAALQQRVLGIVPEFYVSYDPNPVAFSAKQKFYIALRATTDPVSFLTAGVSAGIGQGTDLYGGYGQGAEGYAKRYGAAYGDDLIDVTLGSAVFPVLFHQDPRYFYKGTGTNRERALYAVKSAFICKGDNGKWQFNYSHILGDFAAAGISNAYYPSADRGAWLTMRNGLVDTAGSAAANVLREFVLKGLTPKAPKSRP